MYVSHRHRFIFVRTEKTAGSSLSELLRPHLAPGDLRSDMSRPAWARYSPIHHGALKRNFPRWFGPHTHATIGQVRSLVSDEVFRGYFKFCVERNPWDRQVSLYFQRIKKNQKRNDTDFDRDMRSFVFRNTEHTRLNNWNIYTIDNKIAVDRVIRYENLVTELPEVLAELGLPTDGVMPRLRSGFRDERDYRHHYSEKTKALVARWYAREIDAFGYEF